MIVYYSNKANAFVDEPAPLMREFLGLIESKKSDEVTNMKRCPAVRDYCHNVFVLKNPITYNLKWSADSVASDYRDQAFFNNHVRVRSIPDRFFSYEYPYYLFLSERPLMMEQLPPFMHDCDAARKLAYVPGVYDIGKHFRPLDTAMFVHRGVDEVRFEEADPLCYVRFHTDEKIQFKKFMYTAEIENLINSVLNLRQLGKPKPMQFWYDLFTRNYRKKFLAMVKDNLLED